MRIGHGYDVHRLVEGRKLILGGVEISWEKGLDGHSDADVLVHAIMDSILGAAALGDIGHLFPDTDDRFKGADSILLLLKVQTVFYCLRKSVVLYMKTDIELAISIQQFLHRSRNWLPISFPCGRTLPTR